MYQTRLFYAFITTITTLAKDWMFNTLRLIDNFDFSGEGLAPLIPPPAYATVVSIHSSNDGITFPKANATNKYYSLKFPIAMVAID